jgi:hypothetical protein
LRTFRRSSLLWRGSRDGFGVRAFHSRCDGHANTLVLIQDTEGNIFGGFTPVKWESRPYSLYNKVDQSLKSFLFTLKNPHNVPARKFALKAGKKNKAICCNSLRGPHFRDIWVLRRGRLELWRGLEISEVDDPSNDDDFASLLFNDARKPFTF